MNLTTAQKQTTIEALKTYWQYVKNKLLPTQALPVIQDIKVIIAEFEKIEPIDVEDVKPVGVSDEQFENVCKFCDQYEHKCKDVIAMKFPGKCDPILKYNRLAIDNPPSSSVKAMLDAENLQFNNNNWRLQ